ncbi:MAG: hypothetical protein ACJAU9_001476 [Lentimonas sp.]|jgi:hypothetical protein
MSKTQALEITQWSNLIDKNERNQFVSGAFTLHNSADARI